MRWKALLAIVVAMAAAFWFARPKPAAAPSQPPPLPPVEAIRKIAPNLYLVAGGGCNSVVFVSASGVILVDTKYKTAWPDFMREIGKVTDKPVTHVVNSHRHPDHSEGNTQLPAGVRVVAHRFSLDGFRSRPMSPGGAGSGSWIGTNPLEVNSHVTIGQGDEAVDVAYFGPAHSGGDVLTYFRSARVLHTGDVMPGMSLPTIVVDGGGSGVSLPTVLKNAVASFPDTEQVITGHGGVVPSQALVDFAELNQLLLDHVRANMRIGADKKKVFGSLKLADKFKAFDLQRSFATMDEIDRSIRPWWQRVW